MTKLPIIIDTDPGIDDFFALMLARHSKFDVKGLTAVCGNQTLDKTSYNLLCISELFQLNTRVAKGSESPLNNPLMTAGSVHGEGGLGSLKLNAPSKNFDSSYAWDVIYEEAKKTRLRIVAIGPLTNIAIALLKYPNLPNYIEEIVFMGGTTGFGNHSIYGEFNILGDPYAADIVLKSRIPLTMMGLNVTNAAYLDDKDIEDILSIDSKYHNEVSVLLSDMKKLYKSFGKENISLHDALTVAYLINPNVVKTRELYTVVETRSDLCYGRTIVDINNLCNNEANVNVSLEVDRKLFIEILKDGLSM